MTINKAIEKASALRPCAVPDEEKAGWLIGLDGRIYHEVTGRDAPDRKPAEKWTEDGDAELLIPAPYDDIYVLYVQMLSDYYMRDYEGYNNAQMLYSERMTQFQAWWRRTHLPRQKPVLRGVF